MMRGAVISRYKDDNVSVICDIILCSKAAFYMFNSCDFFMVGGLGQTNSRSKPLPFHVLFLTEKLIFSENTTCTPIQYF